MCSTKSDNRIVYCFDTNIFITVHRYYPISMIPDLWGLLKCLVNESTIVSHIIVFNEIVSDQKKQDALAKWITPFRGIFKTITQEQMDFMPDVLRYFPKLIDEKSEKEDADPYLIAMLLELQQTPIDYGYEYILVTNENVRSPHKLPAACKHYGIKHINLFQFFEANRFEFRVNKR